MIYGIQELYIVITNREPVEMNCQEFLTRENTAEWLKLNECYLDNSEVIAVFNKNQSVDKNSDFYIPVRPSNYFKEDPVKIFFKINSLDQKIIISKLFSFKKNTEKLREYYAKHQDEYSFLINKKISSIMGKVLFGVQVSGNTRDLLKRENKVSQDFIIISENEKPSIIYSLSWILGGLLLGFLFVWWSPSDD